MASGIGLRPTHTLDREIELALNRKVQVLKDVAVCRVITAEPDQAVRLALECYPKENPRILNDMPGIMTPENTCRKGRVNMERGIVQFCQHPERPQNAGIAIGSISMITDISESLELVQYRDHILAGVTAGLVGEYKGIIRELTEKLWAIPVIGVGCAAEGFELGQYCKQSGFRVAPKVFPAGEKSLNPVEIKFRGRAIDIPEVLQAHLDPMIDELKQIVLDRFFAGKIRIIESPDPGFSPLSMAAHCIARPWLTFGRLHTHALRLQAGKDSDEVREFWVSPCKGTERLAIGRLIPSKYNFGMVASGVGKDPDLFENWFQSNPDVVAVAGAWTTAELPAVVESLKRYDDYRTYGSATSQWNV